MKNKLCYANKIEAAYMAQTFGVKLEKDYVNKESEIIFLPQDGDIGKIKNVVSPIICFYSKQRMKTGWETHHGRWLGEDEDVEIILRNNKPFLQPDERGLF